MKTPALNMSQKIALDKAKEKYANAYRKRTPKSHALFDAACKYMPGGDSRTTTWFFPYASWIDKADGYRIIDVDGNECIDFNNCYTALVLGHGNAKIKAAIREQLEKGPMTLATAAPDMVRWAEILCQRVASIDKIRFTNSGTEATMLAARLARAFTGKEKLLMIEGGFHGKYDSTVYPSSRKGLPKFVQDTTLTVPYNDKEAAEKIITENKDQLAAMILEGMMGSGGYVPARSDYVKFVREVTAANNVLLILDEVMTFRFDYGGMQHIFGIKPDLTTLGKVIGGNTPAGACGGREDIMQQLTQNASVSPEVPTVYWSGTFNANPVTAVAGIAALEQITAEEIARINGLGESLAKGIRSVFARLSIKGYVTGFGSLRRLHFSPVPVVDYKTWQGANKDILVLLHLALLERGIYRDERCMFNISTPMTENEIEIAVKAVEDSLTELKPHIEEIWPDLVGKVE